jgi:hypothetical protein
MRTLNILSSTDGAGLEERDDTVVWLTHALKSAGAQVDLLLRGTAANYVIGRPAFGSPKHAHAPDIFGQIAALIHKGVGVFVVSEELRRRGLSDAARLPGAKELAEISVAEFIGGYDRVWRW